MLYLEAIAMAWEADSPPVVPEAHTGAGSSPGCSTSDPAVVQWSGKAARMAHGHQPYIPCGRPRGNAYLLALDHPVPAIVAIWIENQQMDDLSIFTYICNSDFQTK